MYPTPQRGAAVEEDLALPLRGHHGRCRWLQSPAGCLRAGVLSPHSSRAQEAAGGACAPCPQRGTHPVPGHLGAATEPSEWLGDPSPAPLSPDTPLLHPVPDLCYFSWGQTLAQRPRGPEGAQHEPTPGNGPREGGDEAALLFGHPHLLHGWGKPGAATRQGPSGQRQMTHPP